MARMTGGRAVVESLKAHGVDTVFGIISTHTMHIYDALYHEKAVRFIGGRHEHALGFMADGYSRATGRPGVFLTSGGPGAANSIGPMGEAYAASSSVLQITANVESYLLNTSKGGLHEIKDQPGMFRSVTGWNAQVDNVEAFPDHIHDAFQRFKTSRPRPIALEMPTDLFGQEADVEIFGPRKVAPKQPDPLKIEQAAAAIKKSKRPVIWLGSGVTSANATKEVRELAERLGAAVTGLPTGKGAFPEDHPLSLGVAEFGGHRGSNPVADFIASSDLVIIVGCSMPYSRTVTNGLKLPANVIQIDIDPAEIGKNYHAAVGVVGDAKAALQQILTQLGNGSIATSKTYAGEVAQAKKDIYQSVAQQFPNELKTHEALRAVLPRDAIFVGDTTVPVYRAHRCFQAYEPRTYFGSFAWAGLGFAFPASLGAKVGMPNRKVVAMTGDGGFQYNIQELATAGQYGIAPIVIVWNDSAWGVLKWIQDNQFNGRHMATDLKNPDFVKVAEAYGAAATRVHNRKDLAKAVEGALDSKTLHLIEVVMPKGFSAFN